MSRWDGIYSSAILSLAKELSKNNRVFYIDHPFSIKDYLKEKHSTAIQIRKDALLSGKHIYRKVEGFPENFVAVTPKLTLPINWMWDNVFYDLASRINDKIFFDAVRKVIKDYGVKHYIFFNSFNPFFGRRFPKDIIPDIFIYQSRDDISQEKYIARHGVRLEKEQAKAADVALGTSRELTRILSDVSGKPAHLLPNAGDVDLFKTAVHGDLEKPKELSSISGQIIGYIGNLTRLRIDYELLKKLADTFKDKTLLLLGPQDFELTEKFGLNKLENVVFVEPKKLQELPAYLKYINCAIIPFKCNKLTKSIYPLKINEYLAAGKPVVSTNFSSDMAEFLRVISIADSHEDFIKKVATSLSENSIIQQEERIKVAEKNSWEGRVSLFWQIVENYLKN